MSNFFIGLVDSTRRIEKSQRDHNAGNQYFIEKSSFQVFLPEISKKSIFMKSENKSDAYKVLKIILNILIMISENHPPKMTLKNSFSR